MISEEVDVDVIIDDVVMIDAVVVDEFDRALILVVKHNKSPDNNNIAEKKIGERCIFL